MLNWLDRMPVILLLLCILLGLAPFSYPHVAEKLLWLWQGRLGKPVDILDLLMHGGAAVLALLKTGRMAQLKIKRPPA